MSFRYRTGAAQRRLGSFVAIDWIAMENNNAWIDCCGWLRLVDCNIGSGHDTCSAAPGRRDGNASCCRLWPGQDAGEWRMRGTNYRPPDSPSRPQVCAMAG